MSNEEGMEFVFVVGRHKDGRVTVGNLEDHKAVREPTIDDVYAAVNVINRDIQTQQIVAALLQVQGRAQDEARVAEAPERRESGLVVPEPTSKFKKVTRA